MKAKQKHTLMLLVNTAALMGFYFWMLHLDFMYITMIYLIFAACTAVAFIVYNRGFATKNETVDSLPCTMSLEERKAYIHDAKVRLDRSRWMITVILPLILSVAVDLFVLYLLPYFEEAFS